MESQATSKLADGESAGPCGVQMSAGLLSQSYINWWEGYCLLGASRDVHSSIKMLTWEVGV